MANNVPTIIWPTTFEPPPPKGPPPKIPLPMTPTQAQFLNTAVSPMSRPPADEYFTSVNYSPSGPSRAPPRANIRPPILHRLSETESFDEAEELDPPGPPFRENSNGSPVSPHTIVQKAGAPPPDPSAFELDEPNRKGSEPTLSSQPSYSRLTRPRSSIPYIEDEEPAPFVIKGDKHKRILGINPKTSHIRRGHDKSDSSNSLAPGAPAPGARHKRSFPDIPDRSSSPLPGPEVVPFLYQDIEVNSFGYLH
jgi:hypothetical protein